jgi:hypothetical protein
MSTGVIDVLDKLGIECNLQMGNEMRGFCPAHKQRTGKEDRNPSWFINLDTGAHICFSCQFKGNLYSLVAAVKGFYLIDGSYDYEDVNKWLDTDVTLAERLSNLGSEKPREVFEELVHISEASLAAFTAPPLDALKSRGITPSAAEKHELLWDAVHSNWIIPIRDSKTKALLGWQEKGYTGRYFKNQPAGVKKRASLFGYDKYTGGDMIAVESPLDVVRLESVGITGGVATFGCSVTDEQYALLRCGDRLIIAMDNDQAGVKASLHLLNKTKEYRTEAWFFNYSHTDVKDVGAMSKAEIIEGLESSIHSIRYGLGVAI